MLTSSYTMWLHQQFKESYLNKYHGHHETRSVSTFRLGKDNTLTHLIKHHTHVCKYSLLYKAYTHTHTHTRQHKPLPFPHPLSLTTLNLRALASKPLPFPAHSPIPYYLHLFSAPWLSLPLSRPAIFSSASLSRLVACMSG